MFEKIRAAGVGALAGLTAYVAWLTADFSRLGEPGNWRLSGPLKWFLLGGALVGLLGGISLVERWLDVERSEVSDNTILNALFVLFLIAIVALILWPLGE